MLWMWGMLPWELPFHPYIPSYANRIMRFFQKMFPLNVFGIKPFFVMISKRLEFQKWKKSWIFIMITQKFRNIVS